MIVIAPDIVPLQTKTIVIPIKSPHLLAKPIDEKYYYAVNCAYPHSLRILNRTQYDILAAIDNQSTISALGNKLSIQSFTLERFFKLLSQTEIIRFDGQFTKPQKPKKPKSLNFWIHTTNRCNLTCGYCYIPTLNRSGGMIESTQKQLLNKLIETTNNRKITNIKLRLAGGEPLTQFKAWKSFIPEAKAQLKALGCDLVISFLTNLTILTDEILAFSNDNDIRFGVSMDGIAQFNDASRAFRNGTGSFKQIDENLRRLMDHNIPVSVNTVVNNQNLQGLPDLTRYLIDLDIPFRYSIVKGEAINPDLLERYLSESYTIMEEAIHSGWSFSRKHQFCDLKPNELGFQTCASGFAGGAIYVDGTFKYCHVHFGEADQAGFSIFDENIDLLDMIEQGSHLENMKSTDCSLCRYKAVCTSGCPVYRVNGKDPQCSIYHKFIPKIYDLLAKERLKLLHDYRMIEA